MNIKKPEVYRFEGATPGTNLVILGAIHGDEICGTIAIKKVISEIKSGDLVIESGSVTLIPISNPQAYIEKKRFITDNLNRFFKKWDKADSYEKQLANFLTDYVEQADYMLDIHSTTAEGEPNIFVDFNTPENKAFAQVLPAQYAIFDWPQLYKDQGEEISSFDTTTHADNVGTHGVLLECGQHNDPESAERAYKAILNTLSYLKITADKHEKQSKLIEIFMKDLFIKRDINDKLSREWQHLDTIKKGELLATSVELGDIIASYDGYMILPKMNHPVGTEWFYLGKTN